MKQGIRRIVMSCLVLCICMAMAVPSAFAADSTYVISFRPGEHGSFSEDAVSYLSSFGTAQMSAAGNLFVEVESGTPFPANILSYLTAEEGYYYRAGLAGSTVTEDKIYVAEYGVLSGGGVAYTVKYLDSASGAEVAESYTGYANAGDVIPFAARAVNGYDVDSATKSVTVEEGAELTFLYTSNGTLDEIQYQYGENTTETQTVTAPGATTAPADNDNAQPPAEENTADGGEEIDDNDVPLTDGAETPAENAPGEEIGDNEIPLAPGADITDGATEGEAGTDWSTVIAVSVIGIAAIIAIVAATLLYKKKHCNSK